MGARSWTGPRLAWPSAVSQRGSTSRSRLWPWGSCAPSLAAFQDTTSGLLRLLPNVFDPGGRAHTLHRGHVRVPHTCLLRRGELGGVRSEEHTSELQSRQY